jgi:hypothetical protein
VSWPTAHRAFIEHAEARLVEPEPVRVLWIDETRRGRPRWEYCIETQRWVRVNPWDTGFVDLDGEQGLLGQHTGRTSAAVIAWLQAPTPHFREAVEDVAIDPAAVDAAVLRTEGLLPSDTGQPVTPSRFPRPPRPPSWPGTTPSGVSVMTRSPAARRSR